MPIPKLFQKRQYGHLPGNEPLTPKEKRERLIKTLLLGGGIGLVACFIIGTVTVAWVSRDLPDPNKLSDRQISQSTKIYDRTGKHLLYEIYNDQKRTLVEMDQISDYVKQATIAVEDKNFYEHSGVRVRSILRAGFNNIIGRKAGSGGGSTLTQQLIKNTIVGGERRGFAGYFRKIKEAILAIRLEKKYSKEDILKLYLNEVPYGSTNYGVEAASQSYFQKNAKDLTLAEAATLAAIVQAPSRYLKNLDSLRDRRDLVLALMQNQGFITEEQEKEAQGVALRILKTAGPMEAPHFVLYVKQLLSDQFGERAIDEGGLKVITSLDYDKQKLAEATVKELGDKNAKNANANNAALVAIDPKTSQVLALVGSRDYNNEEINGQFDVATLGKRQPGSSFKPFVYTLGFEKGYTAETVLYDVTTEFSRGSNPYSPKNFDGKEHGLVTVRRALQGSLNIPAVKMLYLVGLNNTIEFAKRFGYTTFTGDYGLSLVLGGGEVNLLEHTNAYATLANNGRHNATVSILKVTNSSNETLYEWKKEDGKEAIKPEIAALTSDILSDDPARAWIFGARGNLTLPGRPVAAKTGTTNDNKDAWTMGYTPSLATGVWVGNTIPSPMKAGGNALAGTIWNKFMREALKGTPVENFPPPPPNDATKPVLRGGNGGITLSINAVTGRIATSSTPSHLIVQRTYLPPHDILHYVIKDDPRGPVPTNPSDDPQYEAWERGVQAWLAKVGANVFFDAPSEYDTPTSPELTPQISFVSPTEGAIVDSRQINIQVQATAARGVAKVIYLIDGQTIGTVTDYPFSLSYYAQKLSKGPHTLSAIALDDQGNSAQTSISFAIQAELDPPSVSWFDGSSVTLSTEDFPRVFSLTPFRWEDTKHIQIFLSSSNGSSRLIYTFDQKGDTVSNNALSFTWKNSPGAGEHTLRAVLLDNSGRTVEKTLHVVVQ